MAICGCADYLTSSINTDDLWLCHSLHRPVTQMSKKKINMKGLGLKQSRLLYKMAKENLVIRVIVDHDERQIELQDESGDNSYEDVSMDMLNSIGERGLLSYSGWMPALFVTIDTFSLKREVIERLGLLNSEQNPEECDATEADQGEGAGKQISNPTDGNK